MHGASHDALLARSPALPSGGRCPGTGSLQSVAAQFSRVLDHRDTESETTLANTVSAPTTKPVGVDEQALAGGVAGLGIGVPNPRADGVSHDQVSDVGSESCLGALRSSAACSRRAIPLSSARSASWSWPAASRKQERVSSTTPVARTKSGSAVPHQLAHFGVHAESSDAR
jgi:hypothetical protein